MIKKFPLLCGVFALFLAPIFIQSVLAASNFSDVSVKHPYYAPIKHLHQEGILQGYGDGTFRPEKSVNRAEFLKVVIQASGVLVDSKIRECFPDVPKDEWYTPFVCNAQKLGIVNGYPDGSFRPSSTINKVEALKILAGVKEWNIPIVFQDATAVVFDDVPNAEWFYKYVRFAKENGLIDDSGAQFLPGHELTRGKLVEYMFRGILFDEFGQRVITNTVYDDYISEKILSVSENQLVKKDDTVLVSTESLFSVALPFPVLIHRHTNGAYTDASTSDERQQLVSDWASFLAQKSIGRVYMSPLLERESFLDIAGLNKHGFSSHAYAADFMTLLGDLSDAGITTVLDMSLLRQAFDSGLSADDFQKLLRDIDNEMKSQDILYEFAFEDFSSDFIDAVEKYFYFAGYSGDKVKYSCINIGCGGRGTTYVARLQGTPFEDAARMLYLSYASFFGKQKALQVPYSSAAKNQILFYAAREDIHEIIFDIRNADQSLVDFVKHFDSAKLEASLQNWKLRDTDIARPIANIVLSFPMGDPRTEPGFYALYEHNMAIVLHALFAAGYEVEVTQNEAISDANLYYIFGPAALKDTIYDLERNIYNLFGRTQKVFFHPIGVTEFSENWNRLFTKPFDFGKDIKSINVLIPESIALQFPGGEKMLHVSQELDTNVQQIPLEILGEKDVSEIRYNDGTYGNISLLLRRENGHFVNIKNMHADIQHFLTNLMAPKAIIDTPSRFFAATSQNRTVIYAYDSTETFALQVPSGATITQYDSNHNEVTPTVSISNDVLRGSLAKDSIVLVLSPSE